MAENLILKPIEELLGENFYIPYYQRGYRWTKQQINDLLNDTWNFSNILNVKKNEFYCLQPVVIKEKEWEENGELIKGWEVVDGQQRLTTIYIILCYLGKEFLKIKNLSEEYRDDLFTIRYETRPGSEKFLKDIKDDTSNIDYYHMSMAYATVKKWFTNGDNVKDRTDRNRFLDTILGKETDSKSIKVIWYHVDKAMDSRELFTRLNIGKIPLTNSELIKALFLSSSSFSNEGEGERMKFEISLMWDEMEKRLNDSDFWAFITNKKNSDYANKIELLFDMMANKKDEEIDHFYTFLYFLNLSKNKDKSLWDVWLDIEKYFYTLSEWYKNKNLYHKIGYLITIGNNLKSLIEGSLDRRKDSFEEELDSLIRESVEFNIEDLAYDNNSDYKKIERVLLLFNIESIRNNESISDYYPFKFHKAINWSLEHIHAQNSEGLDRRKKKPWLLWLEYHKELIEEIIMVIKDKEKLKVFSDLIVKIKKLDEDRITWEKFNDLSMEIINNFSESVDSSMGNGQGISNLALISQPDNSALNNSVFEVKRRQIIRMDKEGKYIPICTRRVFLKYYNPKASTEHYYFWGVEDRKNYLNEIKSVLSVNNFLYKQEQMGD